ncbi:MAG: hypothetical protein ABIA37_04330 [Candidatus Woesearchaeota archaeon]
MKKELCLKDRCKFPNNHLFIAAMIFLTWFLLFELMSRIYNLYKTFVYVDIPSHFFAGIAIFTCIYWTLSLTKVKHKRFMSVFFTLVAALVWEAMETLEEWIIENPEYLKDVFFWDGFFDVIFTVAGGIFAINLLYFLKNKIKVFETLEFE